MIKIGSMILLVAVMSGSVVAAELKLVARSGDVEYRQFSAEGGKLFGVTSSGQSQELSSQVRWALEGDLLAHAEQMVLSPKYTLCRALVPNDGRSIEHRPFANVLLRRNDDWLEKDLTDAIAVVVWLVDGQPRWVEATPAVVRNGYSGDYAAAFARELQEEEAAGYPVLLLFKRGEFLPVQNEFEDPGVIAAAAAAHLGTVADFARALDGLETVDVRSQLSRRSLLSCVAEAGRLDMVDELLQRGVKLEEPADGGFTAMWIASYRDRLAVVERLLEVATANKGKGRGKGRLDWVVYYGQLRSAMAMVRDGHRKDASLVLNLALRMGEWETAKAFLRLKTRSPLENVADANLMRVARSGDVELLQMLLKARMRTRAKGVGTTLVIEAVKSGNGHALKVILEAKGNPKVDTEDQGGFRAIDYAVACENDEMILLLKKAGAEPHREGKVPDVPNDKEVVYADYETEVAPVYFYGPDLPHSQVSHLVSHIDYQPTLAGGIDYHAGYFLGRQISGPLPYHVAGYRNEGHSTGLWGVVSMVVSSDGAIGEVKIIVRDGGMDEDFMKSVAQNITVIPGMIEGKAVATRVTLPILVESPNGQLLRPDRF